MARKTEPLGFGGPQFNPETGARVIAPSDGPLLMDFSIRSERSYRGKASDLEGHDGIRNGKRGADGKGAKPGTFRKSALHRQRWTTALVPEALDQLHELAADTGHLRCMVVEALLLDPDCRARVRALLADPAYLEKRGLFDVGIGSCAAAT